MAINPLGLKRDPAPCPRCPLIGCRADPPPDPDQIKMTRAVTARDTRLILCILSSSASGVMSSMAVRDDLEEKPRVKLLSPAFGIDKSRLHGSGLRSKGFAITDLLGLESDIQARQQPGGGPGLVDPQGGPGPGGAGAGSGAALGGFSFPGGSLPLGLGFLCSLAAQQPPGTPCFLPGHLPLLQARAESHYLQNLEAQRDAYSGTAQPGSAAWGITWVDC